MKSIIKILMFAVAIVTVNKAVAQDVHHVKITNNSKWDIDHIYITPINSTTWGSDLLGGDEVMIPGESIDIIADCDVYDVKIIDQDGITCVLEDVIICDESENWLISDLTKCHK